MPFKKIGRGVGWVTLVALMVVNLMIGASLYSKEALPKEERDAAYDHLSLFTTALEQIRRSYVDADKTEYRDLVYGALRGMLQSLDSHSAFLDPEMFDYMKDDTSGHFGGIGIVISMRNNILTVVAPMEDTPGSRAGLMSGDHIVEINGESTEGLALQEAVRTLRGPPGTDVTIKVVRPRTSEIKEHTITRAVVSVESVRDAKMLEDGIGYIRVTQFSNPTADDLRSALDDLKTEGMRGLILDLRNNPGGLLSAAVEVSQQFLRRGDLIVYTQGRDGRRGQRYTARQRNPLLELPMVVLINEGSASASEIVAGALQDHRRAVLIGEKTFGKGSVQSVLPLGDGSALRLTTAQYYTPSERVIDELGIEPDILVPVTPDELRKLIIMRTRPENTDPEFDADLDLDLDNFVDTQLERALDVLKGIMIFETSNAPVDKHTRVAGLSPNPS